MMKPRILLIFFISIIYNLSFTTSLYAQDWKFIKERDGIKIYTRNDTNNPVKSYRGEVDLKTTMDTMRLIIGNIKSFDWWDESISQIKVLEYVPEQSIKYYLVYHVQWPFSDRDLCVQSVVTNDSVTGVRTVMATPLLDVVPEQPDKVRIKNYWQSWTLIPLGNGMIHLTLEGSVDPGGNIPAWLVNMVITDTPLNLIKKVRSKVEAP
jgi:hypothetical protein